VKEVQTVVVVGKSLLMSSIGASLQDCAGLQVLTVAAEVNDAAHRVGVLQPDVVLFDLGAAQPDFAVTLWKGQPDLLLIGVDLATNEALVLSGKRTRAYTTEDLLQVIQRHDPDKAERG
jgi:DNA-binding NarL/FixJ family response regulator